MNSRHVRALLLLVAATCACGPALYPIPLNPVTDATVLLQKLSARRAGLVPMSAVARIESWSKDGTVKGRTTFLVDPKGRLRMDAWSPTDDLIAALAVDPQLFLYFERGAPECLSGAPCRTNIDALLPLGLDLQDACLAMYGQPPVRAATTPWEVAFDRRAGAYRLDSGVAGGTQALWVREDGTPVKAEYRVAGNLESRMEAEDFATIAGIELPRRLHFIARQDDRDVTIKFRSLDLGGEIPEEDWSVDCPRGLPVRTLQCGGQP